MMNHDNPNQQTIEYKYAYLLGAIQVSMVLRNAQQIKDFLGDALDHVRPNENVKQ